MAAATHQSQPLFDATRPDEPHPSLMHEYIRIFSQEFHTQAAFVSCERLTAGYLSSTLSAPLANAIAALAVPMAHLVISLQTVDLRAASEVYLTRAKQLVMPAGLPASIEHLEALTLICYMDMRSGRAHEVRPYMEKAVLMTIELNKRITFQHPQDEAQWGALRNAVARLGQAQKAGVVS